MRQKCNALTSEPMWWRCLLHCTCHATCIFADPRHRFASATNLSFAHFWQGSEPIAPATQATSQLQKSGPGAQFLTLLTCECSSCHHCVQFFGVSTCGAFSILTSKGASHHSGVHSCHISTSKSAPRMMFVTFWLRNVLRATAAQFFMLIRQDGSAPAL